MGNPGLVPLIAVGGALVCGIDGVIALGLVVVAVITLRLVLALYTPFLHIFPWDAQAAVQSAAKTPWPSDSLKTRGMEIAP